ncbi:recombinase family protein [Cytobacillus firmus]|uniref:recombinase family protein n=1 Tax=Cytobacillus firmus TaxID=1399 RepID=UPI00207A5BB4|nr:recombinase family protein [Cytobacillus firmus]USK40141.1 recombinase family protein [Cytobacillus firmus]
MKAAVYARVSTDEQFREGYSIDSQKENIINFIKSQSWDVYDIYTEEGYSAKNLNRPAMQRLIKDVKDRKFDVVVFYKLDRLVRSVSDLDKLLQLFDANKIAIRSVTEPFDTTTAMGRFLITLVAAIAQWERETISERVVINMTKKANMGERNGGKAPFGYNLKDGLLEVNPEEARFVKEIFRMYTSGKGMRSITLYLNQFGISKDIRTIGRMIENPVYAGKLRWANNSKMDAIVSEDITHTPIIDLEVFEAAQNMRIIRATDGKKATSPFHFSGVLKCARCGSSLSGYYKKARKSKHYVCIAKKNKGTCDLPMFTESALTNEFINNISPDDPEKFFRLTKDFDFNTPEETDQNDLIKELENSLAAIKTRKKNWLMALGNGVITQDEYISMTHEDTKKEELLKEQLKEISHDQVSLDKETILQLLKSISQLWITATDFEKKSFINDLFSSIIVDVPQSYTRGRGKTPSVIIDEVKLRS